METNFVQILKYIDIRFLIINQKLVKVFGLIERKSCVVSCVAKVN